MGEEGVLPDAVSSRQSSSEAAAAKNIASEVGGSDIGQPTEAITLSNKYHAAGCCKWLGSGLPGTCVRADWLNRGREGGGGILAGEVGVKKKKNLAWISRGLVVERER